MVSVKEVKPGNLLVSVAKELHLIIEIHFDDDNPEKSVIVGINEHNIKFEGTPDKWFHLWDSNIDISQVNLQKKRR